MVPTISAQELKSSLSDDLTLIDVREDEEFEFTHIENSIHIPLALLESKIEELKSKYLNSKIVMICRSGQRSHMASQLMMVSGFKSVKNLEGGLLSYSKIDSSIIPY